jgi:hypothetical protein
MLKNSKESKESKDSQTISMINKSVASINTYNRLKYKNYFERMLPLIRPEIFPTYLSDMKALKPMAQIQKATRSKFVVPRLTVVNGAKHLVYDSPVTVKSHGMQVIDSHGGQISANLDFYYEKYYALRHHDELIPTSVLITVPCAKIIGLIPNILTNRFKGININKTHVNNNKKITNVQHFVAVDGAQFCLTQDKTLQTFLPLGTPIPTSTNKEIMQKYMSLSIKERCRSENVPIYGNHFPCDPTDDAYDMMNYLLPSNLEDLLKIRDAACRVPTSKNVPIIIDIITTQRKKAFCLFIYHAKLAAQPINKYLDLENIPRFALETQYLLRLRLCEERNPAIKRYTWEGWRPTHYEEVLLEMRPIPLPDTEMKELDAARYKNMISPAEYYKKVYAKYQSKIDKADEFMTKSDGTLPQYVIPATGPIVPALMEVGMICKHYLTNYFGVNCRSKHGRYLNGLDIYKNLVFWNHSYNAAGFGTNSCYNTIIFEHYELNCGYLHDLCSTECFKYISLHTLCYDRKICLVMGDIYLPIIGLHEFCDVKHCKEPNHDVPNIPRMFDIIAESKLPPILLYRYLSIYKDMMQHVYRNAKYGIPFLYVAKWRSLIKPGIEAILSDLLIQMNYANDSGVMFWDSKYMTNASGANLGFISALQKMGDCKSMAQIVGKMCSDSVDTNIKDTVKSVKIIEPIESKEFCENIKKLCTSSEISDKNAIREFNELTGRFSNSGLKGITGSGIKAEEIDTIMIFHKHLQNDTAHTNWKFVQDNIISNIHYTDLVRKIRSKYYSSSTRDKKIYNKLIQVKPTSQLILGDTFKN